MLNRRLEEYRIIKEVIVRSSSIEEQENQFGFRKAEGAKDAIEMLSIISADNSVKSDQRKISVTAFAVKEKVCVWFIACVNGDAYHPSC